MFEFLVQAVSGLDLAAESPSPTLLPLSLPGFAKMPTTRVVRIPQSTALLYLHQVGRSSHTLTHTLTDPLTAGQMQDRVCLQAQDWDLTSSEGAPPPSRSYLLPAWALTGGNFCPRHPPTPLPGGPDEQFPLSRDPAFGSLPSRVHGLSTHTPPHPVVLTPRNPTFAFCRR